VLFQVPSVSNHEKLAWKYSFRFQVLKQGYIEQESDEDKLRREEEDEKALLIVMIVVR
jgi:hypothetical protein